MLTPWGYGRGVGLAGAGDYRQGLPNRGGYWSAVAMSEGGERKVCFAGCCVNVFFDSGAGDHIVNFLFADVPEHGDADSHVSLSVKTQSGPDPLSVFRDDECVFRGDSEGALANFLLGETIYHLADESRDGLVLHAAAVSRDGVGMILPGNTGAGKTTLTVWLAHRGLNYLSDELVYIEHGSHRVQTFTRPLNVKTGSVGVLRDHLSVDTDAPGILACSHAMLIPHRQINPTYRQDAPELRAVVFPQYRQDGELELEKLSRAQAGMRMMSCLVNARNLAGHGFPEVARLVRQVEAYEIRYSSFDQLGSRLEALLQPLAA